MPLIYWKSPENEFPKHMKMVAVFIGFKRMKEIMGFIIN